jgi:benzoyl-CoA 2,3-dioxygenase component B
MTYPVLELLDGKLVPRDAPALNALNERLRDDYIRDTLAGVGRWNRVLQKNGVTIELTVPHKAFNRQIGPLSGVRISPEGRALTPIEWDESVRAWLPTAEDHAFIQSLMGSVTEAGRFANWIAPPPIGINKQPLDFQYVRFD